MIIDTERDGHRVAFNRAFEEFGLGASWDPEVYHRLLQVAGGKERLRHFLHSSGSGLSVATGDEEALIALIHKRKTDIFLEMLEAGALPLRPGVRRLMGEINELGLFLGVCTTSDERAARAVTSTILKGIRFDLVLAGDAVARKKPDPEIYQLALEKAGLKGRECIAIEDSHNGVEAAKGAGLFAVVTTNPYTELEDLSKADIVVTCLGDPGGEKCFLRHGNMTHDGVLRARQLAEYFSS